MPINKGFETRYLFAQHLPNRYLIATKRFAYTFILLLDIYATLLLQYLRCFIPKPVRGVFQYLLWGYSSL